MLYSLSVVAIFIASLIGTIVTVFMVEPYLFVPLFILAASFGRYLFADSMNLVYGVGPIYWITRDNGTKAQPIFSTDGFMYETAFPWRRGRGLQFRFGKYVFQIGICRYGAPYDDEAQGVLSALGGRYMTEPPKEIGGWK